MQHHGVSAAVVFGGSIKMGSPGKSEELGTCSRGDREAVNSEPCSQVDRIQI